MYQPYIDILVDGVMRRRDAYETWEESDPEKSLGWGRYILRPYLNDNEYLRETIDGRMEIVTFPLDKRLQLT
jgi:hypothetical protein